jgi:hypothetical protein
MDNLEKPAIDEKILSESDKEELWNQIGFHKALAGFWYKLIFSLFSIVFGLILLPLYYKILYPYPESAGYRSAAIGIFLLFFTIFDLGTWSCMDRFIAPSQVTNPKKMLQYIQYFIWYQMITGLIQTTCVSIYALYFVPRSELGFAVWIMLIHSTTQYPGFLGVFRGVLNTLQEFNKSETLGFISGEFLQKITEIGFVIWGKQWGQANPAIGEIMGIAIGATIGLYVDDFFATALSAVYFSKSMKSRNIGVRDCFRIDFDGALAKEVFIYGLKAGMTAVWGGAVALYELWLWLTFVPQFTTFATLNAIASGLAGIVNQAQSMPITMLLSESFNNGKKKLAQYYIAQAWRFYAIVQAFFTSMVLIVLLVLASAFEVFGMEKNYILAIPFLIPNLLRQLQQPYTSLASGTLMSCDHPSAELFIRFIEEGLKIFFLTLFIHPAFLGLPDKYGFASLIWIMPCGIYPAIVIKVAWSYRYINKNMIKLRFLTWQSLGAPIIASIITYTIALFIKQLVFDPLHASGQTFLGLILMIGIAIFLIIFVYFPFTSLLGGWDDNSLRDFKKAMIMSGPSKGLVWLLYQGVNIPAKVSRLHNKFGIDATDALLEAQTLLEMKNTHIM